MNINTKMVQVLFAGLLIGGCTGQAVGSSGTQASGVVSFAEKLLGDGSPDGKTCNIAVPPWLADFKLKDTACKNDTASYFKFENVPSSTFVELHDNPSCDSTGNFWFELRAIKQPTSSGWYEIARLSGKTNTIILPGIMRQRGRDSGQIKGKLSCVRIRAPHR